MVVLTRSTPRKRQIDTMAEADSAMDESTKGDKGDKKSDEFQACIRAFVDRATFISIHPSFLCSG